ncbi:MAG: KEOPS complex subunit Pcc1 [Crenarchaeota archaeon]|nr:KEOPS complex subunit Pcc1 [Thermoproteota archaeon]MCR8453778.1 KEOPS complex subunit Pcc1 [Thermoproteota archaeon]MCR8455138.1 KEOPS complex subunit Pcc1 [Thermoproteota archaeon]MCR8462852.1 KEOPS complex subunit Pcc1 [Thermoproteota archaeon]MCR8470962.1 KEOPS complex subunit Pcc1 [Thermoproteota archaeon]
MLEGIIKITLKFERLEDLIAIYKALVPETKNPPTHRSEAKVWIEDRSLKIEISSKDLISLRAALNSYLRWIYILTMGLKVMKNVN